jgi:hypothetical protein
MLTSPRFRSLAFLLGALRALFVLGLVLAAVLLFGLRAAEAQGADALLGFGGELMRWTDTRMHSAPRRLSVNGLEFHLVTASTPLSVKDTLERLHGLCRIRGGIQMPETLLKGAPSRSEPHSGLVDGTISRVAQHEGVLACLDTGGPLDLAELTRRLGQVSKSGDLSLLGELRYVVARREGDLTTALILWTEGAAPLLRSFPGTGDAPGQDPEGCPRPGRTRRLLAAQELGAPYSVTVYSVDGQEPAGLREWYAEALKGAGWTVRRQGGDRALIASRGGRQVMVHVGRGRAGRTTASVVELS